MTLTQNTLQKLILEELENLQEFRKEPDYKQLIKFSVQKSADAVGFGKDKKFVNLLEKFFNSKQSDLVLKKLINRPVNENTSRDDLKSPEFLKFRNDSFLGPFLKSNDFPDELSLNNKKSIEKLNDLVKMLRGKEERFKKLIPQIKNNSLSLKDVQILDKYLDVRKLQIDIAKQRELGITDYDAEFAVHRPEEIVKTTAIATMSAAPILGAYCLAAFGYAGMAQWATSDWMLTGGVVFAVAAMMTVKDIFKSYNTDREKVKRRWDKEFENSAKDAVKTLVNGKKFAKFGRTWNLDKMKKLEKKVQLQKDLISIKKDLKQLYTYFDSRGQKTLKTINSLEQKEFLRIYDTIFESEEAFLIELENTIDIAQTGSFSFEQFLNNIGKTKDQLYEYVVDLLELQGGMAQGKPLKPNNSSVVEDGVQDLRTIILHFASIHYFKEIVSSPEERTKSRQVELGVGGRRDIVDQEMAKKSAAARLKKIKEERIKNTEAQNIIDSAINHMVSDEDDEFEDNKAEKIANAKKAAFQNQRLQRESIKRKVKIKVLKEATGEQKRQKKRDAYSTRNKERRKMKARIKRSQNKGEASYKDNLPSFQQLEINMTISHLENNPDITDRPVAGFIYDYIEDNKPHLLSRVIKKD